MLIFKSNLDDLVTQIFMSTVTSRISKSCGWSYSHNSEYNTSYTY